MFHPACLSNSFQLSHVRPSGRFITNHKHSVLFGRANSSTYLGQTIQGPEGNTTFQYFYRVSSFRGDADFNCTLYTRSTTRFTDTHDALTLTSTTDGLDLKNHTFVALVYSAGRVRDLALQLTCAQSPYDYGMDLIIDNVSVVGPTDWSRYGTNEADDGSVYMYQLLH